MRHWPDLCVTFGGFPRFLPRRRMGESGRDEAGFVIARTPAKAGGRGNPALPVRDPSGLLRFARNDGARCVVHSASPPQAPGLPPGQRQTIPRRPSLGFRSRGHSHRRPSVSVEARPSHFHARMAPHGRRTPSARARPDDPDRGAAPAGAAHARSRRAARGRKGPPDRDHLRRPGGCAGARDAQARARRALADPAPAAAAGVRATLPAAARRSGHSFSRAARARDRADAVAIDAVDPPVRPRRGRSTGRRTIAPS